MLSLPKRFMENLLWPDNTAGSIPCWVHHKGSWKASFDKITQQAVFLADELDLVQLWLGLRMRFVNRHCCINASIKVQWSIIHPLHFLHFHHFHWHVSYCCLTFHTNVKLWKKKWSWVRAYSNNVRSSVLLIFISF